MFTDLETFVSFLDQRGQLIRIAKETKKDYEIGLTCRELCDNRGPAAVFACVPGFRFPVVSNLFGDYARIAAAFDTSVPMLNQVLRQRLNSYPVPPRVVDSGPAREVVSLEDSVDLTQLPVPVWHQDDGGPCITWGIWISKHPDHGHHIAKICRMQVHNRRELGIQSCLPSFDAGKEGGIAAEGALVIGGDPLFILAAYMSALIGWDVYALAGAFRGYPLELLHCATVHLQVPAHGEIVLEGITDPEQKQMEGPFCELTGYMGSAAERPVVRVTGVTCRKEPLFLSSYVGKPPSDAQSALSFAYSAFLYRVLKDSSPLFLDAFVPPESCGQQVIIKIEKVFDGPNREEGKRLAFAAFGAFWQLQQCVVVEKEVDIYDPAAVEWALATRVCPDKDITIIPYCPSSPLNPADEANNSASDKYIIDATRKYHDYPDFAAPPAEILERIDLRDYID